MIESLLIGYVSGALCWAFLMGLQRERVDFLYFLSMALWPLLVPGILGAFVRRLFS